MSTKNYFKQKYIVLVTLLIVAVLGICWGAHKMKERLLERAKYTAENDIVSIEMDYVTDVETLFDVKPDFISIQNSWKELEEHPAFLVGTVYLEEASYREDAEYRIRIIPESTHGEKTYEAIIFIQDYANHDGKFPSAFYIPLSEEIKCKQVILLEDEEKIAVFQLTE